MKKRTRSRLLLVDADVARACGGSDRPPAPQALRALDAIYSICHHALVTPELHAEWARHAARNQQFQRWRRQMLGRKKIIKRTLKELAPLADQLALLAENEGEEEEVRKDAHLVCAALEQGVPVVSLDDRMRRFLARCLAKVPRLARVTWVNPLHSEEDVLGWLERGARTEAAHQLQSRRGP